MTAPYTAGTIDLVSGSSAVVGTDTAWEISLIIGGTIYVEFDGGNPMPIATVDSDTEITAALKWTGPTGAYSYAIVRDTAYGQQTVTNAQALATYIQRLNNPALAATAGVTPGSNKLLLFTGANTATVIDLEDLLQGVKFDEEVPTLADRAPYDGEAEGFRVLVANIGDGRSAFYTKKSAAVGDWTVPFYITGPVGGAGPYTDITIGSTETLPAGSQAEVTLVPLSPGVIRLDFGLPKGADGTGTGDVNGPAGGVANNFPVAFDTTTGKLIKAITGAIAALHALTPAANKLPYFTGAGAAALTDLTALARSLLDDADGATMFATMGATSGTGWMKLPNGRLMQWGTSTGTTDSGGNLGINFPTSFSSGSSYNVVAWSGDSAVASGNLLLTQLRSSPWPQATGFAVSARTGNTGAAFASAAIRVDWIAMGVAP
ncbi:hypothetical protein [Agrobacterium tumefaciens]|uniref:gp53-like domain-containing protein n=1 Tax=Agrobacterium tumefaciens TaxID=358 RepID=UPI0021D3B8D5|nr:hypothetical protein [Agrobacterium tumefaciens]UXS49269.1 hypothetical protein FY149_18760 [Agrobacterium tumefaciens]